MSAGTKNLFLIFFVIFSAYPASPILKTKGVVSACEDTTNKAIETKQPRTQQIVTENVDLTEHKIQDMDSQKQVGGDLSKILTTSTEDVTQVKHSALDSKPLETVKKVARKKAAKKLHVYTDASGSYGAGGYCGQKWFCFKWPEEIKCNQKLGMAWKELFPITVAARMFGPDWSHHHINFHTDNQEVVLAWKGLGKRKCRTDEAKLIKELKLAAKKYQFDITISLIDGKDNTTADAISRGKDLPPEFDKKPIDIPLEIIQDLLPFQINNSSTENKKKSPDPAINRENSEKSSIARIGPIDAEVLISQDCHSAKQIDAISELTTQKEVTRTLNVYTDASGKYGAGGYCGTDWFCVEWPENMKCTRKFELAWKQVFPIALAARLLGPGWLHHHIIFHTHDPKIMKAWHKKRTYKPPEAAKLMEELKLAAAQHQFQVTISTISGPDNKTADAISRGKDLPKELNKTPIKIPKKIIKDLLLTAASGKAKKKIVV